MAEQPVEEDFAESGYDARVADIGRASADGHMRLDSECKIVALRFRKGPPEIAPNDYMLRDWRQVFVFPDLDENEAKNGDWRRYQGQLVSLPDSETIWRAQIKLVDLPSAQQPGFDIFLYDINVKNNEDQASAFLNEHELTRIFSGPLGSTLRQPIGRIIANAETIGQRLQGPLRAEYASYAQDIAQAGRHLLELVEDMSDLEIVESNDFTAASDRIDLADLARRAAGLLAVKASDHNIRIDAPADDETMPAIGEFRRVLQILLNLLTNAIRYSPDGSMIWLRLERESNRAQIVVADQGNGLSAEEQPRVFEKFERLGRSGDGGSGLGLYISRKLARAMDGDLKIESAPGQGARFILELPFDRGD